MKMRRGLRGHEHINKQRRRSLILLGFGAVRIVMWTILAGCVALGLAGVSAFSWAHSLALSIPFVVLISIYANWATDLDAATAAFAALVASDAHSAVQTTHEALTVDTVAIEADIARLAEMQPCAEATELANDIRARLAGTIST